MSVLSNSFAKFALDNIKQWGTTTSITRLVNGAYDATELTSADEPSLTFDNILVCPLDYNSKTYATFVEEPGLGTSKSIRQLYIVPTSSYTPMVGDLVELLGADWRIQALMALYEINNQQCAYLVHIEG